MEKSTSWTRSMRSPATPPAPTSSIPVSSTALIGLMPGDVGALVTCFEYVLTRLAITALHVDDEIFCSASLVIPDKAGRILNIAGWTGASNFGIRLLTPSGSFGEQGTTDWEQDPANIALQVRALSMY